MGLGSSKNAVFLIKSSRPLKTTQKNCTILLRQILQKLKGRNWSKMVKNG